QDELARAQAREQCGLNGEDAHRGARLCAGKVERRTDEDVPEPLDRPGRLTLGEEEIRESLVVVLVCAGAPQCEQLPRERAVAQRQVAVAREENRGGRNLRPSALLGGD